MKTRYNTALYRTLRAGWLARVLSEQLPVERTEHQLVLKGPTSHPSPHRPPTFPPSSLNCPRFMPDWLQYVQLFPSQVYAQLAAAESPCARLKTARALLFHSTVCVDVRHVRLGRVVVSLITTSCAVFIDRGPIQWVVSCSLRVGGRLSEAFAPRPPPRRCYSPLLSLLMLDRAVWTWLDLRRVRLSPAKLCYCGVRNNVFKLHSIRVCVTNLG